MAVTINVQSARDGTFTVTCTSTGGTVLSSSFTGPAGEDLGQLEPVGTPQMRGQDMYSSTTPTRTGGRDGDMFNCVASNGVSNSPSGSATLRGTDQYLVS